MGVNNLYRHKKPISTIFLPTFDFPSHNLHTITVQDITNQTICIQLRYTNTVKTQQIYYTLSLTDYMFRLLRVIIRPSNELTQDYLIPTALWDPVALIIVGAIIL